MCDQQRLRPACAYAQSDQSLCLSLAYSMSVKLLTEHHLVFLSLKGGRAGSSESTLVKMPHCWKSHVVAHIYLAVGVLEIRWCTSLRRQQRFETSLSICTVSLEPSDSIQCLSLCIYMIKSALQSTQMYHIKLSLIQ